MPTSGHFLFIPGMLLIGGFIGFIMGLRAQVDRAAMEARREEQRKVAREERAARKSKIPAADTSDDDASETE